MRHPKNRVLVGYWRGLRNGREVPDQTDIDPRAIKHILADIFILDATDPERPLYRLAGTSHCGRYGGELKGANFLGRWEPQSRGSVALRLRQSLAFEQPVCIASVAAIRDRGLLEIETVLAPLTFCAEAPTRFIGIAQPVDGAAGLGNGPVALERLIGSHFIRETEPLPPPEAPPPRPFPPGLRTHAKPHLKLVVSHDEPDVRFELGAKATGNFRIPVPPGPRSGG